MRGATVEEAGIANQREILNRLYDLKCRQLQRAERRVDTLLYQVLNAEAEAISEAIRVRQQSAP